MKKTFKDTERNIEINVQECTAICASAEEKERVKALFIDYYNEFGVHMEIVVFNWEMPKTYEDYKKIETEADYYEWDTDYETIESVEIKK